MNYILASLLLFAIAFNLFFSRRNKYEVEGYERSGEKYEDYCARRMPAAGEKLLPCFRYLDLAGFDRLCILEKKPAAASAGLKSVAESSAEKKDVNEIKASEEAVFVFINKNYCIYLDIRVAGDKLKCVELMSQFSDSKIYIIGSDEKMAGIDSRWIDYEFLPPPAGVFEEGPLLDYICPAIKKQIDKMSSAHAAGRSPFYATGYNYASCRNYVADIVKLNKMAEEMSAAERK